MSFAEGTTVPVERSRAEIEHLIKKYGASEFASAWLDSGNVASIQFQFSGRRVRFTLHLPNAAWARQFVYENCKRPKYFTREHVPTHVVAKKVDEEHRRRWRCLLLAIKAKLEIVESGIATFEEEFLAHIVVDNQTVYERIQEAVFNGRPLLPAVTS